MTQFVGCYRAVRRCFHCGFEVEMLVLEGEELTEPSDTDYCLGVAHHQRKMDANEGDVLFGVRWHSRMEFESVSLLRGARGERVVA